MVYLLSAAIVVLGYLLGNVNFALIISKLKKSDVRKRDSGNPGAMNMIRNYGTGLGALTLLLDAIKGALSAVLGWFLFGGGQGNFFCFSSNHFGMLIGGAAAIIGHIYPVFLRFKGGKGISTTIGVCFITNPYMMLISGGVGVLFILFAKMGAVTSFIIISFPLAFKAYEAAVGWAYPYNIAAPLLVLLIFLLTLFKHRGNIKKLFTGKENKTVLFKGQK